MAVSVGAAIDTSLLVVGCGPAALVAAKVASGHGLSSLVAGHEVVADSRPITLSPESLTVLRPHGVLDVLRPYASMQDPFTIAPLAFEQGLKHHCVADMLVTVFDQVSVLDLEPPNPDPDPDRGDRGTAHCGVLTDGRSSWDLHADGYFDAATLVGDLNALITGAAAFVGELIRARQAIDDG